MVEYALSVGLVTGFALGVATAFFTKRLPACVPSAVSKHLSGSDMKLVLVVRTDLGMKKGKIAAQCAHAVVGCYKTAFTDCPKLLNQWEAAGQPKIVLQLNETGEGGLVSLRNKAAEAGLVVNLIRDAGRTQVARYSATVLGIGPGPAEAIDPVVKHLKLL